MSVWVVVGGQFGSEGKGKISAIITLQEQIDICIRCGGPNSGHSFQKPDGKLMLLRQLPTGFVRPQTRLLIPAGGLIDLEVLRSELEALGLDAARVGLDRNAMVITTADREKEQELGLSERLSSTLCGVGSAVARNKLRRVGRFDWGEARRAVMLNRPTRLALNFVDYLGFENRTASRWEELNPRAMGFIEELEDFRVPVSFIGIGPQLSQSISRGRRSLMQARPQISKPDPLNNAANLRQS